MDGEHLLHECSPEVQQPHCEWPLIFRAHRQAPVLQKLPQVRAEFDGNGRFAAAGGSGFNQPAIGDFAGAAEKLLVREPVASPEPADGLTFVLEKCKRRMSADGIPESLEFPINAPLAQGRLEGGRIKEDVDVFRKALDQVPAFRQTCAALQNEFVARGGDDSQCFRDIVVFLDDCRTPALVAKVLCRLQDRLVEGGCLCTLGIVPKVR